MTEPAVIGSAVLSGGHRYTSSDESGDPDFSPSSSSSSRSSSAHSFSSPSVSPRSRADQRQSSARRDVSQNAKSRTGGTNPGLDLENMIKDISSDSDRALKSSSTPRRWKSMKMDDARERHGEENYKAEEAQEEETGEGSLQEDVNAPKTICKVLLGVVFWYTCSVSMTLVNKYLFDVLGFSFQLLVTFLHFGCMSLILRVAFSRLSCLSHQMPSISVKKYVKFVAPISFFSAVDIALGNEAYSLVGVSAMTVIKSSIVVFTYLLSVASGLERFRWTLFCLVITIGASISLTVPGMEVNSYLGIFFVLISTLAAAARWVLVHHQLQREFFGTLQLMLLTQPLAAVFLFVPAVFIDVNRLIDSISRNFDAPTLFTAAILAALSIVLALLLIFSEYYLVGLTSSVSLCVAGAGKEIVTILSAIIALREEVSLRMWMGIAVSITGIVLYSKVRYNAMKGEISTRRNKYVELYTTAATTTEA